MYVTLQSSTCFEHKHAHLQEGKLYYHNRMRSDCSSICSPPAYCTAVYREWRYQMLW